MTVPRDPWHHDLFQRVPATVTQLRRAVVVRQRLAELQAAAHVLVQMEDPRVAAVGARLLVWLTKGGNLLKVLGVSGAKGAHRPRL